MKGNYNFLGAYYLVPSVYLPILLIPQIFTECYTKHFIYAVPNNPHFHPCHKCAKSSLFYRRRNKN